MKKVTKIGEPSFDDKAMRGICADIKSQRKPRVKRDHKEKRSALNLAILKSKGLLNENP